MFCISEHHHILFSYITSLHCVHVLAEAQQSKFYSRNQPLDAIFLENISTFRGVRSDHFVY